MSKKEYKAYVNYLPHFQGEKLKYATAGSIGFDLNASVEDTVTINSGKRLLIPTGIRIYSPDTAWFIYPRSGLAAKLGVNLMNCVAVIDSDYLGEVKICMFNSGDSEFLVGPGMRIAQGVINNVDTFKFIEVSDEEFDSFNTERGVGGFGSTGV